MRGAAPGSEIARPLGWYEIVWLALPLLLIFAGGAIGAIVGLVAGGINARSVSILSLVVWLVVVFLRAVGR